MSDWKKILGTVAPTLASAYGGPLAGMITAKISKKLFDIPEAPEEQIAQAVTLGNSDVLLKLKEAEQEFLKEMERLGIEREKIAGEDRASARRLAVESRSWTPEIISWLVIGVTLIVEGAIMLKGIPDDVSDIIAGRILGMLDTAFVTVLAFWLGTSHSSRSKDETISRMTK